jgi:hypothetical protein
LRQLCATGLIVDILDRVDPRQFMGSRGAQEAETLAINLTSEPWRIPRLTSPPDNRLRQFLPEMI